MYLIYQKPYSTGNPVRRKETHLCLLPLRTAQNPSEPWWWMKQNKIPDNFFSDIPVTGPNR